MNAPSASTLEVDVDSAPTTVRGDDRPTGVGDKRWFPGACTLGVALVAAAVTSFQVGHRQLWGDEYATWAGATRNMPDFERLLSHVDRYLALFYLFMHGWIDMFGDSPTSLRIPNVIAMSLAAGLIVVLGRRLFDLGTGVIAGLVFAAIPTVSRYAQEARPYGIVSFLAVLATLLLVRAIESPTWPRWLFYAATMVVLGYTHIVAISLAGAHVIAIIAAGKLRDRRRLVRSFVACVAIAVLVLPYAYWVSKQSSAAGWIPVNAAAVRGYPVRLVGSWSIVGILAALSAVAMVTLAAGGRRARLSGVLLAAWAIIPPLLVLAGGTRLHLFLFRYFLFTMPAWVLLAAAGAIAIARFVRRLAGAPTGPSADTGSAEAVADTPPSAAADATAPPSDATDDAAISTVVRHSARSDGFGVAVRAVVAVALIASVGILSLPAQRLYRMDPLGGTFPDYRDVAKTIIADERPTDGIVYAGSGGLRRGFSYELRDAPKPRDVFLAITPAQAGLFIGRECKVPASCLGSPPRLWLVSDEKASQPYVGLNSATTKLLEARFTVQSVQTFIGVRLFLLVAKHS